MRHGHASMARRMGCVKRTPTAIYRSTTGVTFNGNPLPESLRKLTKKQAPKRK